MASGLVNIWTHVHNNSNNDKNNNLPSWVTHRHTHTLTYTDTRIHHYTLTERERDRERCQCESINIFHVRNEVGVWQQGIFCLYSFILHFTHSNASVNNKYKVRSSTPYFLRRDRSNPMEKLYLDDSKHLCICSMSKYYLGVRPKTWKT